MPIFPLPAGGSSLAGGALAVNSAADVLAEFPDEHRVPEVAPVRDAFAEGFAEGALAYQREASRAAAQSDPARATGIYLDLHGEDRDVARHAGEIDEDYRPRLFASPAVVTPTALLAGINALLATVTTKLAQLFEPELDGWFVHECAGAEAWESFFGSSPTYPDRLYVVDTVANDGYFVEGGDPGGAVPPYGDHGRTFVIRIPALEGVDENTLAALTGVEGGVFLFDGTETVDAQHLFEDSVTADEIYAAIVDFVSRFKGQGLSWSAIVDPSL